MVDYVDIIYHFPAKKQKIGRIFEIEGTILEMSF
jgi:hypothetical protein